MNLRARLALAAGIAVAVAVVAVTVSAYAGTRSELRSQIDQSLNQLAAPLLQHAGHPDGFFSLGGGGAPGQGDVDQGPGVNGQGAPGNGVGGQAGRGQGGGSPQDCDRGLGLDVGAGPGFGGAAGLAQFVSRTGATCQARGSQVLPVPASVRAIAKAGSGRLFFDGTVSSHHLRLLTVGIAGGGALELALPLTDVDHTLRNELLLLAIVALAGIALAALMGVLVARTALLPIARFTRQTEAIAANPERIERDRVEVTGRDELARLAETFNTTLDALAHSVQSQRNLVADASHELRTPIASIRANLQLLLRDEELLSAEDRDSLRQDVISELDELTALVGDVVELARGAGPEQALGEVRLDEVAAAAAERFRRRAPELTIVEQLEPTLVLGNGDRIARAVSNLLDNAVKWSPPGAAIELTLREGVLTVRDHGPGFHEEDLAHIFDRFHRARDARSKPGSGLGLAIVRQAVEAHDGWVRAANAPDGGAVMSASFGPVIALEDRPEVEPTVPAQPPARLVEG